MISCTGKKEKSYQAIDTAYLPPSVFQNGHPIKNYMSEFFELSNMVPWNEDTSNTVFWNRVDNHLFK